MDIAPSSTSEIAESDPVKVRYLIKLFNHELDHLRLSFLREKSRGREGERLRVRIFDTNAFLHRALAKPTEFEDTEGLKELRKNCWAYNP